MSESPERPDLTQTAEKPDIVDRLRMIAIDLPESATTRAGIHTLVEAVTTIKALREMNERHCNDERLLKRALAQVADLEQQLEVAHRENEGLLASLAALRDQPLEGR